MLTACAGGDAPTAPPEKPSTPPPAQNPDAPIPTPTLGALNVQLADVPSGAAPTITVSATGVQRVVRQSRMVDSLPPGDYQVVAEELVVDSIRWEAEPATQVVSVRAGQTAPLVSVRYRPKAVSLIIAESGLPSYARASVRIAGPNGFSRTALTRDTVRALAAGTYTVVAEGVETTDGRFEASQNSRSIVLTGSMAGTVSFEYGLAKAKLTVAVDGLPGGALAGIVVSGPAGFSRRADATNTFAGLEPGTYRAAAARVSSGGFSYDPDVTSRDVTISGTQQRTVAFNYSLSTGAIAVLVAGLPNGSNASVRVTGPSGYSRTVSATQTLTDLAPGAYRVTASPVSVGGVSFAPSPASLDLIVAPSLVAVPAEVQYHGAVGAISVAVQGLPPSLQAVVKVSRAGMDPVWLSESSTLEGLPAGQYLLEAQSVSGSTDSWDPDITSRQIQVTAGSTVGTSILYLSRTGNLNLSIVGLPEGVAASVRVSGQGLVNRLVGESSLLFGLRPGMFTVTADPVVHNGIEYTVSPAVSSVEVTRGETANSTLSYGRQSTSLTVDFTGLPGGTAPLAQLTGPNGFARTLTGAVVLEDLTPGAYRVTSSRVSSSTASYDPTPSVINLTLASGDRITRAVDYNLATGSLAVSVAGLPNGTSGAITVTGPAGFSQALTGTQTLIKLEPGTYTVTAANVSAGGATYAPSPVSRSVVVVASLVASPSPVTYAAATGGLRVSMTGLPAPALGAVTLLGPNGASNSLSQTAVVPNLAVGNWEVRGNTVTVAGERWAPTPVTRVIAVVSNDTVDAPVSFARVTGRLTVSVAGLPLGASADITVTGPNGFLRTVNSTQTIVGLEAGTYTLSADAVVAGATNFTPDVATQTVAIAAGGTASRTVTYSGQTTAIAITVNGVPAGAQASILVTGPNGFSQAVTGSTSLAGIAAGTYTISATRIVAGSFGYTPTPASQSVTVTTGDLKSATVAYAVSTGALAMSVSGLPAGVSAPITVTGPAGFSRVVTETQTLTDLAVGSYTITAGSTSQGATSFTPNLTSQTVTITAGSTAARSVTYTSSSTSLTITVSGLPVGVNSAVTVTGPNGFSRSVTGSTTLTELAAGTYTVVSANVAYAGGTYSPTPTSQTASLVTGQQLTRTVAYAVSTASLTVSVSGVPTGANAAISVTGPNGYSQALSGSQVLSGLAPGNYTVSSAPISANNYTWTATPPSASVTLVAGDSKLQSVAYAAATGRLTVTVGGLPSGTNAPITVTGPAGFSQSVTGTTTLNGLAPGSYTVSAATVTVGSTLYAPSNASQSVTVSAGATGSSNVTYSGSGTSLAVTVGGLPVGVDASVSVTGPGGFAQTLTATTTLNGLAAGTYTVTSNAVSNGGYNYSGAPATQSVAIAAGDAKSATVTYSVTTGRLTVGVSGLPAGTNAAITVTGPNGYSQSVAAGVTLQNLAPGTYTVAASDVTNGSTLYTPSPASQTASVTAGATLSRSVAYTASGTSLVVTISGVPAGANGAVAVTGPGGYVQNLTGTTTLNNLAAGTYTVSSASISNGGYTYTPTPSSQAVAITVGQQKTAAVAYAATTGRLTVTVSGLPVGVNSAIVATGPNGFTQNVTATTTLSNLTVGTYTLTASNVVSGGSTYAPGAASQTVSVTAGTTAARTVAYTQQGGGGANGPNLVVEGAYITQAIQSFTGEVPLVAGREALLRVFVTADAANTVQPQVRVRLYEGATNFRTFTINAPTSAVPTAVNEGTLNSSWNATLSASDLRVGLRIQVDVDPTGAVNEPNENDNVWPSSGTRALDVRTVAPFNVVFVPVHQSVNGLVGNVTTANLESNFLSMTRKVFPLAQINASVRATYTTNAPVLQSNDGNWAWLSVLGEMNSLRIAEGSNANYFGVVNTTYGSGVAGYAYTPGKAGVAWDKEGTVARVTAHELGHNFTRKHVAACGSGNPDLNYPYAGGIISNFGWDAGTGALVPGSITDIMGYCGTQWVSDYTWSAVMNYRGTAGAVAQYLGNADQPALMVWGRIIDGVVTLEPSFRVVTRPVVAQRPGAYRLELRDKTGRAITGFSFDPDDIDHHDNAQTFNFAVPLNTFAEVRLASVVVLGGANGPTEQVARVAAARVMGDNTPAPVMLSTDDNSTQVTSPAPRLVRSGQLQRVTWDDAVWPVAMVRDAQTGQILSYLRKSGDAFVPSSNRARVVFSNGVKTVTMELPIQ